MELGGVECPDLLALTTIGTIVLPSEGHAGAAAGDRSAVGDATHSVRRSGAKYAANICASARADDRRRTGAGRPCGRRAAWWNRRMMGHGLAPAVQHGGDANAGAEVLRVSGDRGQGLGRGLEQEIVNDSFVLIGDVADRRRQCEHHVIVRHLQQVGLAFGLSTFLIVAREGSFTKAAAKLGVSQSALTPA
jgi:Bacterial regulatory helix-turn-helix protein, lysR family